MAAWVTADFDTFGRDDPEPPQRSPGALLAALREWEALRPAWQHEAACRDAEGVEFFPERGQSVAPAKAVCATCPVVADCEAFAWDQDIKHGVWAGVSMATAHRRGRRPMA